MRFWVHCILNHLPLRLHNIISFQANSVKTLFCPFCQHVLGPPFKSTLILILRAPWFQRRVLQSFPSSSAAFGLEFVNICHHIQHTFHKQATSLQHYLCRKSYSLVQEKTFRKILCFRIIAKTLQGPAHPTTSLHRSHLSSSTDSTTGSAEHASDLGTNWCLPRRERRALASTPKRRRPRSSASWGCTEKVHGEMSTDRCPFQAQKKQVLSGFMSFLRKTCVLFKIPK